MYKITPQASKTILDLSKTLPALQRKNADGTLMERTKTYRVLGKDLPKEYKKKNDWHPMKHYISTYKEPVLINHHVYLIEAFKKDGYLGLEHYTNHVVNVLSELPPRVKQPNFFQRLFNRK